MRPGLESGLARTGEGFRKDFWVAVNELKSSYHNIDI